MVGTEMVMTVTPPFDGSDAPMLVNGKPSGQTMGIKWVDAHHTITVLKMNGKGGVRQADGFVWPTS